MRLAWPVLIALLIGYSALLLHLEWTTSQEAVRPYFTDIQGSVFFYGVNTTLASTLQFGAALLFCFAGAAPDRPRDQKALYAIQGLLILYTAIDDRFFFHETLSTWLRIGDGWIMLSYALVNILAYLILFRPAYFDRGMAIALTLAAGFYFLMEVCDSLVDEKARLRLSAEDLCKSWSAFFLLVLGWRAAEFSRIADPEARSLKVPEAWLRFAPPRWRGADA